MLHVSDMMTSVNFAERNPLMIIIKTLALVLCAALLVIPVAGDHSEDVFGTGINTVAAMKTYSPDKVMLSSGDLTVTWGEFYFILHDIVAQVTGGFLEEVDWSEPYNEINTWSDEVKSFAIEQGIQSLMYKYGVEITGVTLDSNDLEYIQSMIDTMLLGTGSSEELDRNLQYDGFANLAVFESIIKNFSIQEKLPSVLYGETYNDFPDDATADFVARSGYMCAKHILIVFEQDSEASKKEAFDKASDILDELSAKKNDAGFADFFDTLMAEHSEDPGSFSFPDGYLFQYYDMVEPFSKACSELEPGQISGIVESLFGYHIIHRLPIDYDNMVPYSYAAAGQYISLRQLAILEDYNNKLQSWRDSLSVTYSPELEALDVGKMFVWND